MAKRRKQTPTERAYSKQVKRIKQFISRAEKRGYQFDNSVLPQRPKRVTQASVRKLAKLTPDKLYKKAVYGGLATDGEIVPAIEGRKLERSLRAKKAAQTRKYRLSKPVQEPTNTLGFVPPENILDDASFFDYSVISQWYATLELFSSGESYNLLRAWMGNIVRTHGKHNAAIMLQNGIENGHLLTWDVVYKAEKAVSYIGYMIDYLPDEGVLYKEEMLDKIEYMKRLGDALEQDEDWEYPL